MMQFIVLGQIPGTQFQLTFGWFQVILWPLLMLAMVWVYRGTVKKAGQQSQHQFDVINLRSLEQA